MRYNGTAGLLPIHYNRKIRTCGRILMNVQTFPDDIEPLLWPRDLELRNC